MAMIIPGTTTSMMPICTKRVVRKIRKNDVPFPIVCRRLSDSGESDNWTAYVFTIASLIASSNLIGIMPLRFYHIFKQCWPLCTLDFAPLQQERVDFSLHYNKLSLRDPVMQNIINVIHQAF